MLAILARLAIRKYQPLIIGVTGSVGKTSAREAIFAALKDKFKVSRSEKNYNNEIGLPLAVLGIQHCGRNVFFWIFALVRVILRLSGLVRDDYPNILVLEYGIDRPGDMDYLLSIAKPKMAVVTAIGEVPVHVEFFKNGQELINEKAKLVESLPDEGLAILNHDDYVVYDMREKTKANVVTFGFEAKADIRVMNYELGIAKDEDSGDIPEGINFKIGHKGHIVHFWIKDGFGRPQALATAVAAAVAVALGRSLVEVSQAVQKYIPLPGRMRLVRGIKKSFILDDTYNAAPEAMYAALDTFDALPGKRKIAVLGDMLEIGKFSEQVHRAVGGRASGVADILVSVGPRAKFIADEARVRGLKKMMEFDDSVSAGKALGPLIQPGDLILVKGSQSMRMEKVVEEVMAHPEFAGKLLVRQEKFWRSS